MAGDWFTATSAAAAGGTTTVFAFSTQDKGGAGVLPMVEAYLAKANVGACIDYGIHVIVSDPTPEVINAFLLPTLLCGLAVATTCLLSLLTIQSFLVPMPTLLWLRQTHSPHACCRCCRSNLSERYAAQCSHYCGHDRTDSP
jgi:hypothetical protein